MKQKKALTDMLLMLFFMVFAAVAIWYVIPSQIKVTAVMEKEVMSPRTVPYLAAGGVLLVSAIGFVSNLAAWLKARREEGPMERERKTREQWADALLPYGIFALIVVYGLLFKTFGIVAASLIVPPVILFLLRCRKWYMYLILYAFFGLMYALFTLVLHVPIK